MKLRRHGIILALLLVVAVMLGTACKAATLGSTPLECSSLHPGNAKATFNWIPGAGGVVQYLDLSLFNNGFAAGTFVSVGPLPGDANTFVWDGMPSGAAYVFRVNTFDGSTWWPSTTGYFTAPSCAGPPPGGGDSTCIETCIEGSFDGLEYGKVYPLCNGQVWRQTSFYTWYYYWYRPRVRICPRTGGYEMYVEGIDHPVNVERLR